MKTRLIVLAMIAVLVFPTLASCKQNKVPSASSSPVSSEMTSSEKPIVPDKQAGWGDPDSDTGIKRPSFLATAENGDIFYCDSTGSIYKKLSEGNGLSKIYSSSGYDFVSIEILNESLICAGYKNSRDESGYIIFNLKDKTVASAVLGDEFKGKSIYGLVHSGSSAYFLSNPDRYGRYTLYRQTSEATQVLSGGVNEFFILRNRIFYNVGGYIFSVNLDGSDMQMIGEVVTNDLLGFTISKNSLFYMSSNSTYHVEMYSGYRKYTSQIKVYTSSTSGDYVFFCGVNGGIYAFSHTNDSIRKISDYTAEEIAISGEYLYLKPANAEDYPDIPKELVIQNNLHRFKISDIILEFDKSFDIPQNEHTTVSSSISQNELPDLMPEKFGI